LEAAEKAGDQVAFKTAFDDAAALEQDLRVPHRRYLGFDIENKQFRHHEADAAENIEQDIGRPLERLDPKNPRHAGRAGDWVDPISGRTYDAVGPVPAGHFQLAPFTSQIEEHLLKTGVDVLWVDLTGLSAADRRDVLAFIASLARPAKPLIRVFP
jgi:hypothetical protein